MGGFTKGGDTVIHLGDTRQRGQLIFFFFSQVWFFRGIQEAQCRRIWKFNASQEASMWSGYVSHLHQNMCSNLLESHH